jgi:Ca2+-binding EF-hand superfamily protein
MGRKDKAKTPPSDAGLIQYANPLAQKAASHTATGSQGHGSHGHSHGSHSHGSHSRGGEQKQSAGTQDGMQDLEAQELTPQEEREEELERLEELDEMDDVLEELTSWVDDAAGHFRRDVFKKKRKQSTLKDILGDRDRGVALSKTDLESCKMAFMIMDMNEDGTVGMDELRIAIEVLGGRPTEEELSDLINLLGGEGKRLRVQDWIDAITTGKLHVKDHDHAFNVEHLLHIRDAFKQADQDNSGYITFDEFHAMQLSMSVRIRGKHMLRIWENMAKETQDWHLELVCWISDLEEWEEDPRKREKLKEQLCKAVAAQANVSPLRVHVTSIFKGQKTRLQTVKNLHEKATLGEQSAQIATVTIVIDTMVPDRLRTAAIVDDRQSVKMELDKGIDVNSVDDTGATVLHMAAVEGHREVVSLLLKRGADPSIKDSQGRTALDLAESTNVDGIVDNDRVVTILRTHKRQHDQSHGQHEHTGADHTGAESATEAPVGQPRAQESATKLRDEIRIAIREEAHEKGKTQGAVFEGMEPSYFRIRKFLRCGQEKMIDWQGFVLGMAEIANTKIGEKLNVTVVAKLDSVLLKKAIGEEEHTRALNNPSVSPLERWGVKFLSGMSRRKYFKLVASKGNGEYRHRIDHVEDSFRNLEQGLELHGGKDTSVAGKHLIDVYMQENRERASTVILQCKWKCACIGGLAAFLCAMADVLVVQIYQPDTKVYCTEDERTAHHNVCERCAPDHQHFHAREGQCPYDKTWDFLSNGSQTDPCCAMRCGDSGAEASLFGFGAFEGGLSVEELRRGIDRQPCPAMPRYAMGGTVEECYVPDCVESHFHIVGFILIVVPIVLVSTVLELFWMYYDTLVTCMCMSHAVGLVLWPLDAERFKVASNLVKAAFELGNPTQTFYGVNPMKNVSEFRMLVCGLAYMGKTGVSKFAAKLLIRRGISRAGVRSAADAAYSALIVVPIGMLWNYVIAHGCAQQARLRALGTIVGIHCVDMLLPLHSEPDTFHTVVNSVTGVLTDEVTFVACTVLCDQRIGRSCFA